MYKGIAQDRIIFCGGGVVKCAHLIQSGITFMLSAIENTLNIRSDDQTIAKTMAASSEATAESDPKEFAELATGAVDLYEHALGPRVFRATKSFEL